MPDVQTKTVAEVIADAVRGAADDEVSPEQWDARRDTWLGELTGLYRQIEAWLEPAIVVGHAHWIERVPVVIREDFIGQYQAPSYELEVGRRRLVFRPVGTLLVGSRGRVDVVGGTRSVMLILGDQPESWTIVRRTPRMSFTALDEDSFAGLLDDFLAEK